MVEREREAGGIPRHSRHTGFGLRDLHRLLTGPQYAARRIDLAVEAGVRVRTSVSVTGWASPPADGVLAPMAGLSRCIERWMTQNGQFGLVLRSAQPPDWMSADLEAPTKY